ncbi:diacylglycerol/lipid kinase family protein [Geomonas azotofigens]|uniref:diacylglycerol/lipid kinase family protein n=1 Tax=Geomonas azotofigens TaxID=2843196 RepID=UPI001C11BD09|nr:diacylglycerol kinase family protein [Geomonas azotofigens]MBU5612818.1 NAD(+)/NADH kinase [Geomonas azotofigens]
MFPKAPFNAPIFMVMNAGSGDRDADSRAQVIDEVLLRAGRTFRMWRVAKSAGLADAAREAVREARQRNGIVVAAGGDGTINAVAQEVLGTGCPFGVLPQGTFNYFGRSHGIPVDTAQAAEVLVRGTLRPVQVGLVNDKVFLVNASVGLYPRILEKREVHKRKFGRTKLVALLSAFVTLLTPPPQLVLTLQDGETPSMLHIATLLVENNPLQLEQVGLPEADAVQGGELAAVAVKARGVVQMLGVLALAALRRLRDSEMVISFPFARLTVQPLRRRRIKVATDGEITWQVPPLVFKAVPHGLLLIVPDNEGEGES